MARVSTQRKPPKPPQQRKQANRRGLKEGSSQPLALSSVYATITGHTARGPAIAAALKQQTERRRLIVQRVLDRHSYRAIAAELGITHGAVRSALVLTMKAVNKELLHLPRYHNTGRKATGPTGPRSR